MVKDNTIKVIDLFAGPGGLGEGFSSYNSANKCFKIGISIEKDEHAHMTLLLRAFFRQFDIGKEPQEYFEFITKKSFSKKELNILFEKFPEQSEAAINEALCLELGKDNKQIFKKIQKALSDNIKNKKPWVLIGGPPCQAYSLAGRVKNNSNSTYNIDTDHRSKLYEEYLRIIARYQPNVFVMENVKGMLSTKVEGQAIANKIISELQDPSNSNINEKPVFGKSYTYKLYSLVQKCDPNKTFSPKDFLIRSELYGIPQKRHRVIILGVREDYDLGSIPTLKQGKLVTVQDAIYDLPPVYSRFSNRRSKLSNFDKKLLKYDNIKILLNEFYSNFCTKEKLTDKTIAEYLSKYGNSEGSSQQVFNKKWYYNPRLDSHTCNHEARTHMRSDILRYFFVSCFGKANSISPKIDNFPKRLLPAHNNIKTKTDFVDRFKVQLADKPSSTITCHISKDGHYYIHPDPKQCRSLTVREAARLQTFPDDYFFCSNKTEQYKQVGNAVPPLLARQIAKIVWNILAKHT